MAVRGVERLLRPRSVAIVGASATPGSLGASVLANLERMQFAGDVYLINPNRDTIGARSCLKSIEELPLGVDVAVLAIPRAAVIEAVESLSVRQAGAAIIFSAGFAEGVKSGLADQLELARIAAESGLIIEGPNCLGLVNYVDGIALTFVETPAIALGAKAGIGIVSQSGAMAAVIAVTLTAKQLGISYSVSTGNEAASGVEDYVEFLLDDPHTKVVALVVEQFRQPTRFIALAGGARAKGKPIVLLHPGRSGAARESAATHTGAMAGDYGVMRALVERAGVLFTETLEEFGDVLDVTLRCTTPPSGGAAVLTESGAFKALTLDLCDEIGLPLPVLTDQSALQLRAALPDFVPVSNPVDLTAQGLVDPDLYRRALAALLEDERFGCVIFTVIQTDEKTCAIKFPTIIEAIRQLEPKKPVIFAGLDEAATSAAVEIGYPVVFKAQSAELPHKSDAGGVVLNIKDADAIGEAWARLHANITRSRPGLRLEGVLVERMSKSGVELIIGGRNDPDWGPIVLAGFGGIQAEILKDVRLLTPDLGIEEIVRELHRLKSGRILRGYRGAPALDVTAVAKIIARISALLITEPELKEVDLNPVIVYPDGAGAIALDALIIASG
jgi:acyl-CoA synthetase (NDP forming)